MCGYIYSGILLGLLTSRTNVFVSSLYLYEYQHMYITGRGACAVCARHWYRVHVLLHRPDSGVVVTAVLWSGEGFYENTAGNNRAVDSIYNCTHAHTHTSTIIIYRINQTSRSMDSTAATYFGNVRFKSRSVDRIS